MGVSGRSARDQRGRRSHDRRERPVREHGLRRHRRGEHLRLGMCRRRGNLQVDQRRPDVDRPHRPGGARRQGRRRDTHQARFTEHDLRGHDDGSPRHVRGLLLGCHAACSGRGQVGPVQVDQRRCDLELHPQRIRERRGLHGGPDRVQQRGRLLAARRPFLWRSTRQIRRSSMRARTHEESGARRTGAPPGHRSSRR